VPGSKFPTTSWSLVLRAAAAEPRSALEQFCGAYRAPVLAYIRSHIADPQEAEDLTQAFFTNLVEAHALHTVRPDIARFRSYLLASVRHFLANERDKVNALKRGGRTTFLPLDGEGDRPMLEPRDDRTPELLFERKWAYLLLSRALARVRKHYERIGLARDFEALKACLARSGDHPRYGEIAARLETTEAAVKMAVHRMRERFGEALRAEVANTVAGPGDVEDEMRHLLTIVSG
jgi:RNA polymerase sigma factor (sigma-70 family)